jgi:CyaY protein
MTLSEQQYDELAGAELRALIGALDELQDDRLEAELSSDILSIEFEDGTKYVVNSHRAARQIWMAAERSAWHFDWLPERRQWVARKTDEELWTTLSRVISSKLGRDVRLGPASSRDTE